MFVLTVLCTTLLSDDSIPIAPPAAALSASMLDPPAGQAKNK